MQHSSAAKKAAKKRHAFIMRRSVNTLAHSRSLNSWPDFPWIEKRDVPAERSCSRRCTHKQVSELESGRERRPVFLITYISHNARYVKYRGVKKASFLRFGFFGSLWTFRWPRRCFIGFFAVLSSFDAFHLRFAGVILFPNHFLFLCSDRFIFLCMTIRSCYSNSLAGFRPMIPW